ncbi:MAG: SEL1-like repeat protein [Hyphomicrobiales bacterium]|nr:SEL1-like repeat protein [Hyphomicrobiales bacterium]
MNKLVVLHNSLVSKTSLMKLVVAIAVVLLATGISQSQEANTSNSSDVYAIKMPHTIAIPPDQLAADVAVAVGAAMEINGFDHRAPAFGTIQPGYTAPGITKTVPFDPAGFRLVTVGLKRVFTDAQKQPNRNVVADILVSDNIGRRAQLRLVLDYRIGPETIVLNQALMSPISPAVPEALLVMTSGQNLPTSWSSQAPNYLDVMQFLEVGAETADLCDIKQPGAFVIFPERLPESETIALAISDKPFALKSADSDNQLVFNDTGWRIAAMDINNPCGTEEKHLLVLRNLNNVVSVIASFDLKHPTAVEFTYHDAATPTMTQTALGDKEIETAPLQQPSKEPEGKAKIHQCDLLAADPRDPDKVAEVSNTDEFGNPFDPLKAFNACSKALEDWPASPRFKIYLSNTLEALRIQPQTPQAALQFNSIDLVEEAARSGYRHGFFALGMYALSGQYLESGSDTARTAVGYLTLAAENDHLPAMVALAQVLEGSKGNFPYPNYKQAAAYFLKALKRNSFEAREALLLYPESRAPQTITAIQEHLASEGLYYGKIDGAVGPKTKNAIENFVLR